jgi:hypothetical protein
MLLIYCRHPFLPGRLKEFLNIGMESRIALVGTLDMPGAIFCDCFFRPFSNCIP